MKKITSSILAALCAILSATPALWAEPVELRNTSGTELIVELLSTESGQVTFTRTSDNMEFTIPMSMLDKPSQKKITDWEIRTKYQPDSAPFFKLGGEYVIPIEIQGNQVTYFDANGQKQTVNYTEAQKLRELVKENKKALNVNAGSANPQHNISDIRHSYTITVQLLFPIRAKENWTSGRTVFHLLMNHFYRKYPMRYFFQKK